MSPASHSITMAKYLFLLFFNLVGFYSAFGQGCSQLKNGTYIIEYDSSFRNYPKFGYEIVNKNCYIVEDGKKKVYDIIKIGECQFRLKSNEPVDTTNFTPLQKALHMQQPFFDIYKVEGNYYYFVNRVDLHVQIYSGRFVRVKD